MLLRAAIIAGLYYLFLVVLLGESPTVAAAISGVGFALMIPIGMLLDRTRYRMQMKRWQRQHGASAARPARSEAAPPSEPTGTSEPEGT